MELIRAVLIFPDTDTLADFIISHSPKKVELGSANNIIICEVSTESLKNAVVDFKAVVEQMIPA